MDRSDFSDREIEVLTLACAGWPTQAIARKLGIGAETVKTHRQRILKKLRVHNFAAAATKAYNEEIIDPYHAALMLWDDSSGYLIGQDNGPS